MELSLLGMRLLLGFVFLSSSLPKLAAPDDFRRALSNYRLLPFHLVRPVAVWLPRLELVLALMLMAGVATRAVAFLAAAALLVFSIAVAINLGRGRRIDCGCFGGSSPREITWRLVGRDVALAAAAVAVAASPSPSWVGSESVAVTLTAVLAVLIGQLLSEWLRLRRALSAFDGARHEVGVV